MEDISFKEIKEMFNENEKRWAETDKRWQENEKRWAETDKRWQENEKRWQETRKEIGGIGKSTGMVTEDFFYSGLSNSMQVDKYKFDYIDRNYNRKRKNTQAEYDIILYNEYKIMIIEVKYIFRKRNLRQLYDNIGKFKTLFPVYKNYKKFGAIAAMTFDKGVIEEANEFGFFILTQDNNNIQILNKNNFEPTEFK